MQLTPDTVELIEARIVELIENIDGADPEDAAEWMPTIDALREVRHSPTTETLASQRIAADEIDHNLGRDEFWTPAGSPTARRTRIVADLCRAGFYERHDPNAVSTHRPKTLLVDGIRFDVG